MMIIINFNWNYYNINNHNYNDYDINNDITIR